MPFSSPSSQGAPRGFTLVELLVVMALMMFLLGMAAPFAASIRSDIAIQKTVRQVKTDLITGNGYALAGKSIAALSEGDLANKENIPAYYALRFTASADYEESQLNNHYNYQEWGADRQMIYNLEKEWPSAAVYLKEMVLKTDPADAGTPVQEASIIFMPPFGRVYLGGTFNSEADFIENLKYHFIELHLQYKDNEDLETFMSFGSDKTINLL
ncbi:type II secretion system protein [Candidatus Peregrinibacteria bacterium]|nr:type II secretion system protein [Candidatus Peregrinibacteria bacterium]